jgi:hypothetical protein
MLQVNLAASGEQNSRHISRHRQIVAKVGCIVLSELKDVPNLCGSVVLFGHGKVSVVDLSGCFPIHAAIVVLLLTKLHVD